jgi:hypothetical protein
VTSLLAALTSSSQAPAVYELLPTLITSTLELLEPPPVDVPPPLDDDPPL